MPILKHADVQANVAFICKTNFFSPSHLRRGKLALVRQEPRLSNNHGFSKVNGLIRDGVKTSVVRSGGGGAGPVSTGRVRLLRVDVLVHWKLNFSFLTPSQRTKIHQ